MKIVAVKECSAGNSSVGEEWVETKIFDSETPISEVIKWAGKGEMRTANSGRLMLTVPSGEVQ